MKPITIGCIRLPDTTEIREQALDALLQNHPNARLLVGVNDEMELAFAACVLRKRAAFPQMEVCGVLACETIANNWSEETRDHFFCIMEQCDKEILLQTHETPDCMERKNRFLLCQSDSVFLYSAKPEPLHKIS